MGTIYTRNVYHPNIRRYGAELLQETYTRVRYAYPQYLSPRDLDT